MKPCALALPLLCLALAAPAAAGSARGLVAEGNAACAAGKFDQALAAYERASVDLPESPHLAFNKGTALYGQHHYAKAAEAFEAAALKTRDLGLEARCQFNLGNCAFHQAQRQADSDLKKALAAFQKAIRHYHDALDLDPDLTDAAHNIEITRLLIKDLLDKIKKQQEKQKEQQKKRKELLDKLKKLIERQHKANDQRKTLADEKAAKGHADDLKTRTQKLGEDQKTLRDDTKALSDQFAKAGPPPQPNQPQPPTAKARQHLDRAATEQAVAAERLARHQLDPARPPQAKALDELNKALASLAGPPQPQGGQDQQQQQQQQPQPQQQQAAKPRDEKARDILDEEKENRERRRPAAPGGYRPVDKDW